jgi:hypothetical protein
MGLTNKIARDRWLDFCVTFSNGNRGRLVSIEVFSPEEGDSRAVESAPLLSVAYDPAGKGNDIVVSTGRDEVSYSHTIAAPVELWEARGDDGQDAALEIVARDGSKTVISLRR